MMSKHRIEADYKEKFRTDSDPELDAQINAALGGLSEDDLYGHDTPRPAKTAETVANPPGGRQTKRGHIARITKDDLFVDFGGKSLGIVSRVQFAGTDEPVVGQEMEFIVDRYDAAEGLLILSRKGALAGQVSWDSLEVGQVVEGAVTKVNKGGLELEVKSIRAFMPAGQVDIYHVPDLDQFIGQRMKAEVTQVDPASRNLILSRRNVLEREREEAKKTLLAELAEGQIRRGTVRNVMDFGAFVDLGGVDGLLHVSEMTYKRGRQNAAEFVKLGDVLDVKVLKIDPDTQKISLSLKQALGTDPWSDAENKYAVGTPVTGRVTKVENFGAFIEVEDGIEGLLPVSEISWQRIAHTSDAVKVGDTLRLVVLSIDPAQKRISFSLKQAGPDPWATVEDRYALEMVVAGTITRVADFGAFVELEPGLEGLVHISELSDQRVRTPGDVVKAGEQVNVRILEIDKKARRIGLSIRKAAIPTAAEAMNAPTPAPAASAPKKKRPELRGGLDFNFGKNK